MKEESLKQGLDSMLEYHRKLLLRLIRASTSISRADLTRLTKLSPTTVGRIIGALLEEDLIVESGLSDAVMGRKARLISINKSGCYAVGLNIDMNQIHGGIVDFGGNVVFETSRSSGKASTTDTVLELIQEIMREIDAVMDEEMHSKFLGIGVGVTGNIQPDTGTVQFSPQLKWSNVPLRDILQERLHEPKIFVDNNVKCTATAEILFGYGKNNPDFVVLYVGTGVGSAVVRSFSVLRSANGLYGEIGHITMHPFGRPCDCGRRGCAQTDICISSLERESGLPFPQILAAAQEGDPFCSSLINTAEESLSVLLSNIVNIYDPPLILLGGELFDLIDGLGERVASRASRFMYTGFGNSPEIMFSSVPYQKNAILSSASIVFHNEFLFQ